MVETQMINPHDASLPSPRSAAFKASYAYKSVQSRLPITLTKVVDHLSRNKDDIYQGNYRSYLHHGKHDEKRKERSNTEQTEAEEELKQIVGALAKLRNEVQTNKVITPFSLPTENGDKTELFSDLTEWNNALQSPVAQNLLFPSEKPKWFESSWLFVEAYLYRRIMFAVQQTKYLHDMDPFQWTKAQSVEDNQENIVNVVEYWEKVMEALPGQEPTSEIVQRHFKEVIKRSLWGNEGDLSHPVGKKCCDSEKSDHTNSHTPPSKDSPSDDKPPETQERVLVMDQTDQIWTHLSYLQHSSPSAPRVDIVCDNAGLELIIDLVLGSFLLETKLASAVHFHVTQLPCYVSDATFSDFHQAVHLVKQHNPKLREKLDDYLKNRRFIVESDDFWSLPYDFTHMQQKAPDLYRSFATSGLIVFKGDLNYRKLDGDLQWPPETKMDVGVRGFAPSAWCVLRALKGDTVVGLEAGREEEMRKIDENWMTCGNFAVVQFFDGKSVW